MGIIPTRQRAGSRPDIPPRCIPIWLDQPVPCPHRQKLGQKAEEFVDKAKGVQALDPLFPGNLAEESTGGLRAHAVQFILFHLGHVPGDTALVQAVETLSSTP